MKKQLLPILFISFVNVVGFTILIPVLPYTVEKYGGGDLMYGIILSAYPFFQFIGAPMLGDLSDKYGRRPILLLSQLGTTLSWVIFAIAYFLEEAYIAGISVAIIVIIISRITDGITGGNNSVAMAYASDVTEPKDRTKVFGMIGGLNGLGLIIGPAIGGVSYTLGVDFLGTAIIAFIISLITLIIMYLTLTESLKEEDKDPHFEFKLIQQLNFSQRLRRFAHNKEVSSLFLNRAFFIVAFTSFTSIIGLFAKDEYNLPPERLGIIFLVIGFYLVFNQMVTVRVLASKFGEEKTYKLGLIILLIGLPLLFFAENIIIFLVINYFINVGISCAFTTFRTLLTNNVENKERGAATGLDESIIAGGSAVAPLFASAVYAKLAGLSFSVFGLIMLVGFVILLVQNKILKQTDAQNPNNSGNQQKKAGKY
ncbi:MAG TPA: MFS transporter [Candidatus Dojkabacteria bacterium]|jgi:MFS family permease